MSYDALVERAPHSGLKVPDAEETIFGGVRIRKFVIPKGVCLVSHCHNFDHPSILAAGKVEVWYSNDGRTEVLTGPTEVKIAKGVKHAVNAIEDSVWYCIDGLKPGIVGGV